MFRPIMSLRIHPGSRVVCPDKNPLPRFRTPSFGPCSLPSGKWPLCPLGRTFKVLSMDHTPRKSHKTCPAHMHMLSRSLVSFPPHEMLGPHYAPQQARALLSPQGSTRERDCRDAANTVKAKMVSVYLSERRPVDCQQIRNTKYEAHTRRHNDNHP